MEIFVLILIICICLYFLYWTLKKARNDPSVKKSMAESRDLDTKINRFLSKSDLISDNGDCPKCGCNEWKLASLVHTEGVSSISTSTTGVGTSLGDHGFGGLGLGVGSTSGTQITELSELAAPPKKPFSRKWLTAIFISIFLFSLIMGWGIASFIFAALSIITGIFVFFDPEYDDEQVSEFEKAITEYQFKRMCLRCGTFYYCHQQQEAKTIIPSSSEETKQCPFCAETVKAVAVLCKHCHSKL